MHEEKPNNESLLFNTPFKLYHEDKEILINQRLISFKYAHSTWNTLKSMLNPCNKYSLLESYFKFIFISL